MRSRLWLLILRELPFPLRWLATGIVRFVQWIDSATARLFQGLRDSPAWYFVTSIGVAAVFLTLMLFISLVHETSGHRPQSTAKRKVANFTLEELERNHDWSVQDRWRVAHLFVNDKPAPKPHDLQIDSRLMSSNSRKAKVTRPTANPQFRQTSRHQSNTTDENIDVRLDLSRPKSAQQGNRLVRGTVLDPNSIIKSSSRNRLQQRDPRLLVQASWNFGSECHQITPIAQIERVAPIEHVAKPTRRPVLAPVPIPEPEIELPRVVTRPVLPLLSFEMAMVRHFSVAGSFPPGSRLVNQSNNLVFPENGHQFPSELVSHQESPWKPFHTRQVRSIPTAVPYLGDGIYDPSQVGSPVKDEFDPALPAVADVALRVQLKTPDVVTAGTLHKSKLVVTNEGADPVSRIEVKDFLSHLRTVVAANPPAMGDRGIDPDTGEPVNLLHREISNLDPGDSREMSLEWIPLGRSHQFQRAYVISHAEISTSTDVIQPDVVQQMPSIPPEEFKRHSALACDIQHLDRVTIGKELELEITVRNTGDTKLHQVIVQIVIPDQFSHRDGETILFDAGNLPVNGRNRTVIKLSARNAGEAINLIHVKSEEAVEAHGRMIVHVVDQRKKQDLAISPPMKTRATNHPTTKPAPKPVPFTKPATKLVPVPIADPLPSRLLPVGDCCCQKFTSPQFISSELAP